MSSSSCTSKRDTHHLFVLGGLSCLVAIGCRGPLPVHDPSVELPRGWQEGIILLKTGANQLFTDVYIDEDEAGQFVLDTGSPVNLIHEPVAERLGLEAVRPGILTGAGGDQLCWLRRARDLTVGELQFGRHGVISADLDGLRESLGADVAGVLGFPLFQQFPFTLDYRAEWLVCHAPGMFRPPSDAVCVPLRLWNRTPHIEVTVSGQHKGWFTLDTGTTSGVVITEEFVQGSGLSLSRRYLTSVSGPTGEAPRLATILDSVDVLGHRFVNRLAAVAADAAPAEGPTAGIIGGGILKHFELTFDYRRQRLWARYHPPRSFADMVGHGVDLEARDVCGFTPLARAAYDNEVDRARALIGLRVDVNARTRRGGTPLVLAASEGALEVARLLVAAGADVNAKAEGGVTVLMLAARGGDISFVEALLDKGAHVNAATDAGIRPLMLAADAGHVAIVKRLLEHGAEVNAKHNGGATALSVAREQKHADVVAVLREAGADDGEPEASGSR